MQSFQYEMLREIYEQPSALLRTLDLYLDDKSLKQEVITLLDGWPIQNGELLIAGSGSSLHSGMAAKFFLEDLCGLDVAVEYSCEYSYRGGPNLRDRSVVVVSQSGETTDALSALREARRRGFKTLAITNATASAMAHEADISMPLAAGVEKAIPATKSFTCQLAVLYIMALYEAAHLGRMDAATMAAHIEALREVPARIEEQIQAWEQQTARIVREKYKSAASFLFLGRGIHYAIAREGALKVKESSYVHAEGYPTGELKHGPNAMVDDRVPLVVLATVDHGLDSSVLRYKKTLQLLRDMRKQGAKVIAVANVGDEEVAGLATDCIFVQPMSEYLLPMAEVVPLQLFSYFMGLEHGINVDRLRNISKVVLDREMVG
jgi:glucosamine--fructose-6-phosphate aminotransferase (isomerizing)